MSTNNDSSFDAFISKIPQFIDPNNLVEPDTPTKKRDLREVISIINQFIKNCADVQPSDASEKTGIGQKDAPPQRQVHEGETDQWQGD